MSKDKDDGKLEVPVDDDDPIEPGEDTDVLEDHNKSIVWAIVKQLKVGTEIKHLQLPSFVLQPRSMLEKLTDAFVHPQIITGLNEIEDPEARFLNVVRFYLSGWHVRPKGAKNPLNPLIGEVFQSFWKLDGSESHYIAEQLSHHPPHSAFVYYNIEKGWAMNANIAPTYVRFYGNSAETRIRGLIKMLLFGRNFEEEYECTYPNFLVKGILIGTLRLEITGKVTITCKKSGYSANIEFKPASMFRGKPHAVNGKIKQGKSVKYSVDGSWDSVIHITNTKTKETKEFFNNTKYEVHQKSLPPVEGMPSNESRKVWKDVVNGILNGDDMQVVTAKTKIETVQRAAENERTEKNIEWKPALFTKDKENYFWFNQWDNIITQIKDYRSSGSIRTTLPDPFAVLKGSK